jgi:hypothetical protein
MCFSAGTSFGASAVLGVIGIVAIARAKTAPQRCFAVTPFLFAVQQFTEGMLWLSLKDADLERWQQFFIYTFLVFAMMIWPVWISFTVWLLEKNAKRKRIIAGLFITGGIVFAGIGYILWTHQVKVVPTHHHLHYEFDFPARPTTGIVIFSLLYFMATIGAPFVSSIKRMKWLGISFAASYLFAVTFYSGFVVSVWCFFAAILSIVIIWILSGLSKTAAH